MKIKDIEKLGFKFLFKHRSLDCDYTFNKDASYYGKGWVNCLVLDNYTNTITLSRHATHSGWMSNKNNIHTVFRLENANLNKLEQALLLFEI